MIDIAKIAPETSLTRTTSAIEPVRGSQQIGPEPQRQPDRSQEARASERRGSDSEPRINREDAEAWAQAANNLLDSMNTHLKFTLHDKTDRWFVQLVNEQTGEVVREFPPKEILEMAARLREVMDMMTERSQAVGVLVDHKG